MNLLTESNLRKTVIFLALPVVARMSLQMIVGLVDMMMVGTISPAAIAAVGMGNQIVFFLIGIITAFSIGTTALVARYIGAKNKKMAQEIAIQSIVITFFLSILIAILGYFTAESIIRLMISQMETLDLEVIHLGTQYLQIIALSIPFFFTLIVLNGIFQGAGDMRTPLLIMGFANIYNILMDYFLIFGIGFFPELGVQGAAIATATSRVIAFVVCLVVMIKGNRFFKLNLFNQSFTLQKNIIKEVLRIGFPAAIEQMIRSSGQTMLTMLVAGLGTTVLAANQIVMRGLSMSFMPGFGFGLAATTLVGQNLGAQQLARAEESGFIAAKISASFMSILAVLLFFFSRYFASAFTADPDVIAVSAQALKILAITLPFIGIAMSLAGALRGAGDTRWVMFLTLVGVWGCRLVLSYTLAFVFQMGFIGIWLGLSVDFIIRGLLSLARYRSGKWKYIKISVKKEVSKAEV